MIKIQLNPFLGLLQFKARRPMTGFPFVQKVESRPEKGPKRIFSPILNLGWIQHIEKDLEIK